MNPSNKSMRRLATGLVIAFPIIGCDRTKPDAAPSTGPVATRADAVPAVPASAVARVDGKPLGLPAPRITIVDGGAMVSVELAGESPAASRPSTTRPDDQDTGYHFLMNVPVASVDNLPAAGWSRVLDQFPEDSADGFFLDGGDVQLVPEEVRAEFTIEGNTMTIRLRGKCFRRQTSRGMDRVGTTDVDATFVGTFFTTQ